METRNQDLLIKEINEHFSSHVSTDAKFTIFTIRNLIESNSLVGKSIDDLHRSINNANRQNERLQKRIYFLTIVTVILALVQVFSVIAELLKNYR